MDENSLKLIALTALIIGALGVGFGAYSTWQVQAGAINGEDGEDGKDGTTTTIVTYDDTIEYPCSSFTEINNSLTAIGTGFGIITIINNISLTNTIKINGGGNYIIQSTGATIFFNGRIFDIRNAKSLTIQNIKIKINGNFPGIFIYENDNPVHINNVHIFGAVKNGYGFSISGSDNVWISNCIVENVTTGILIDSDNVWVSNCFIEKTTNGISQYNNYENAHIYDNIIKNCSANGIDLDGINNIVEGNIINGTGSIAISVGNFYNTISNNIIENSVGDGGIDLYANFSVVEDNIIRFFKKIGIRVNSGCYNVIAGNIIANSTETDVDASCIEIRLKGSYNTIDANGCFNCKVSGSKVGYGIRILSGCNNNTVVGNTSLFNEVNYQSIGTDTYISGNNFI